MIDQDKFVAAALSVIPRRGLIDGCGRVAVAVATALTELGVKAKPMAGYAGWAISNQRHGLVVFSPSGISQTQFSALTPGQAAIMGHAWVVTDKHLVDLTTSTIPEKLKSLDSTDGYKTDIEWCPDYLWVSRFRVPDDEHKFSGKQGIGHYFYQRRGSVEEMLLNEQARITGAEWAEKILDAYRMQAAA